MVKTPLSWGRVHRYAQAVVDAAGPLPSDKPILPFGRGRSYGDSCLNEDGILLNTNRLDHFIAFDRETGTITCEAGVTLRDILLLCAKPNPDGSHWFLPVTPGTKFVSVGGAIANDVHGKNHHRQGTFGKHVLSFTLRRSSGEVLTCWPSENPWLYHATIGGLGLTGLIEQATLQLMRVPGLQMEAEDILIRNLDDFYLLSAESEAAWEYTVAWIDCLARGADIGRGIFSRAKHIEGEAPAGDLMPRLSIPLAPPLSPMNKLTLPALNALYRRKLGGAERRKKTASYNNVLYPLDGLGDWNKLYGKQGFYQYQCVIPAAGAQETIRAQLEDIAASGEGSFLIVLKNFGDIPSPGMLSFPMHGTTLAIDFPNRGASTLDLLKRLDARTMEAGGRVYPAKDGAMAASAFRRYYPQAKDFMAFIDPRFSSSFWRRVTATDETT